jgi:hypothetical protein
LYPEPAFSVSKNSRVPALPRTAPSLWKVMTPPLEASDFSSTSVVPPPLNAGA